MASRKSNRREKRLRITIFEKMSLRPIFSISLLLFGVLGADSLVVDPVAKLSRHVLSRHSPTALFDATLDPLGPSKVSVRQVEVRKRKDLKQFTRYLEVECWKRAELRGLEPVLQAVADACKQINRIVQRAQTDDIYGAAVDAQGNPLDGTNIQGEVQQKLDVLCNTIMMRAFCGSSQAISGVASEEEDEPRCCADVMVSLKKVGLK